MYGFEEFLADKRITEPSVTELGTYNDCARKALLTARKGMNLTRSWGNNPALELGSLVHFALALYYSGSTGYKWADTARVVGTVRPSFENSEWSNDFKQIISHYAIYYSGRDFQDIGTIVGVEVPFTYKAKRGKVVGRVDGIVEIGNEFWIIEHKTARSVQNVYDVADYNMQSIIYILGVQQQLCRPIAGVIYNAIGKSFPKLVLNKDGSVSKTSTGTDTWLLREAKRQGIELSQVSGLEDNAKYFNRFKRVVPPEQLEIFQNHYLPQLLGSVASNRAWRYQWNPIGCSYCGVKSICNLMNAGASRRAIEVHIASEYTQRKDHALQYFDEHKSLLYGDNDTYWLLLNGELTKLHSNNPTELTEMYNNA